LHKGRLLNLSVYGARVELPGALPPGQRLRMVYAPESDATLSVEGRVQWWRRPDASCEMTCHGIAFSGVSAELRQRIQQIAALD
jgi:hypothetical protein